MLSDKQIELLRIGGYLHDIGKIGIPDNILKKNQALTNKDIEIISFRNKTKNDLPKEENIK